MSKHSDVENVEFSLLTNLILCRTLNLTIIKAFPGNCLPLCPWDRYDAYNSRYRLSKFQHFNTLDDYTLRRLLPQWWTFSLVALTYKGSEPFHLRGRGEGSGVKFQTVISHKRLEITPSIWYAFFSRAQALSTGKGYGALGGRTREKVSQNLIFALWLQKWLETTVPII